MAKKLIFTIFFINILQSNYSICSNKLNLIIDTDCAIDDFRAISLFLNNDCFNVKAIIVSNGSNTVTDGIIKIYSLLKYYHKEQIPIYINKKEISIIPEWRSFNKKLKWSPVNFNYSNKKLLDFKKLLFDIKTYDFKITFVALGSLSSVAEILKNDSCKDKIDKVIWYNNSIEPKLSGFNYLCDTISANFVLKQNYVNIDVISNTNPDVLLYNYDLFYLTKNKNNRISKIYFYVHNQHLAKKKLKENHFSLHDELVFFYMIKPELFIMNKSKRFINVKYSELINFYGVIFLYKDILQGISNDVEGIVFKNFPDHPDVFDYDLKPYADSIIKKHGMEEWKSAILTNEMHGHLGIYSILGVKMGILAREYFNAKIDEIEVYSFAGNLPPFSCMNDGLQVSTGATLGRGTIHIIDTKPPSPHAIFVHNNNVIMIKLKKYFEDKIKSEISNSVAKYGLDDVSYWNYVRYIAIKYWYELDRRNIFDIIPMNINDLQQYHIRRTNN